MSSRAPNVSTFQTRQDVRFRVITMGKVGVGKSTLLNTLFRVNFPTSDGTESVMPGEGKISRMDSKTSPFTVFDVVGLEADTGRNQNRLTSEHICEFIRNQTKIREPIHALLVCNEVGRFDDSLYDAISQIAELGLLIFVVLTKVDEKPSALVEMIRNEIQQKLTEMNLPKNVIKHVFATSKFRNPVDPIRIPFCPKKHQFDIRTDWSRDPPQKFYECGMCNIRKDLEPSIMPENEELILSLFQNLPNIEDRQLCSVVVRISTIRTRVLLSIPPILIATASSGAVGLSPIPIADWPILLGIECALATSLALIWGIPKSAMTKTIFFRLLKSFGAAGGATLMGAAAGKVVASLLKFIPGFNIAAMGIDAAVSAGIVASLGIGLTVLFAVLLEKNGEESVKKFDDELLKRAIDTVDLGKIMSRALRAVRQPANATNIQSAIVEGLDQERVISNAEQQELRQVKFDDQRSWEITPENLTANIELQDLSENLEEMRESRVCSICAEKEREIAIIPCGHHAMCRECALKLGTCPMCRGPIQDRLRVFTS